MNKDSNTMTNAIAVHVEPPEAIPYGTQSLKVTLPGGKTAEIDRSFLSGKGTLKLRHIDACLKLAGMPNSKKDVKARNESRRWFNKSVRDVWHAALKHANKEFMAHAKATSIGVSDRTTKKTGEVTRTAKFGYELVVKPGEVPAAKAIESGDAKKQKQSKQRAKRQKAIGTIGEVATVKKTVTVKPETEEVKRDTTPVVSDTVATA